MKKYVKFGIAGLLLCGIALGQSMLPPGNAITAALVNYVTLAGNETISGTKTFSAPINSTVASGSNSITMLSGARFKYSDGNANDYCSDNGNQFECNNLATRSGGSVQAALYYPYSTSAFQFTSFVANGAAAKGGVFNTNNTFSTSGALIFEWQNGGTQKAQIDKDGNFLSTSLKVPVVHGTSTVAQAIESGTGAMTTGSLAVTFGTAFGAAPICVCSHIKATPLACGPTAAASTTAVTFAVATGASDSINWYCIGQR